MTKTIRGFHSWKDAADITYGSNHLATLSWADVAHHVPAGYTYAAVTPEGKVVGAFSDATNQGWVNLTAEAPAINPYTNIEAVIKHHADNGFNIGVNVYEGEAGGYIASVPGIKMVQGQTISDALQKLDVACAAFLTAKKS